MSNTSTYHQLVEEPNVTVCFPLRLKCFYPCGSFNSARCSLTLSVVKQRLKAVSPYLKTSASDTHSSQRKENAPSPPVVPHMRWGSASRTRHQHSDDVPQLWFWLRRRPPLLSACSRVAGGIADVSGNCVVPEDVARSESLGYTGHRTSVASPCDDFLVGG